MVTRVVPREMLGRGVRGQHLQMLDDRIISWRNTWYPAVMLLETIVFIWKALLFIQII